MKLPLLPLVACAALFVWISGGSLPDSVASHFGASGRADGFMLRPVYLVFMLVLTVALPVGMLLLTNLTLRISETRINLPHREYWLAPQRRDETIDYLRRQNLRFVFMLTLMVCYVHWLVVRANAVTPPVLSSTGLIAGLIVFLVSVVGWGMEFIEHFRNLPEKK